MEGEGRAAYLGELGRVEETGRGHKGVRRRESVDAGEERDLVAHLVLGLHRHVPASDGLTSETSKVDGELLGVVLDNVQDRETL
jgi:hypothetical protein